jgi:class 3 adenylate cyclase
MSRVFVSHLLFRVVVVVAGWLAGWLCRKFQYDIFGRSVVLAEEMESGGVVGKVHISDTARLALDRRDILYNFEKRHSAS